MRARLTREIAEFKQKVYSAGSFGPSLEPAACKDRQGRSLEEVVFGDAALGKRQLSDDDEVQIIGVKTGRSIKVKRKKVKTKFLNDISSWTANRALIDIDKENSSGDSNPDAEPKPASKDRITVEPFKKNYITKPIFDKKSTKPVQKTYNSSQWP